MADLTRSGAKVVSRVRLAEDFTDPKRSAELKGLGLAVPACWRADPRGWRRGSAGCPAAGRSAQ